MLYNLELMFKETVFRYFTRALKYLKHWQLFLDIEWDTPTASNIDQSGVSSKAQNVSLKKNIEIKWN